MLYYFPSKQVAFSEGFYIPLIIHYQSKNISQGKKHTKKFIKFLYLILYIILMPFTVLCYFIVLDFEQE